ncbi:hypothetical protein TrLO_g9645 [Triparma laevis f. longispina]|uniref:Uncharacterized protein n=1 Tax=Triparma laevis f. longispina TaxID=1714387 RepID=A0A9W7FS46_9STRA|nr:hypothetical protein TrLO_g9645 [Triparma laevis f. longispina]
MKYSQSPSEPPPTPTPPTPKPLTAQPVQSPHKPLSYSPKYYNYEGGTPCPGNPAPLAFLTFFIIVELYYSTILFSGCPIGGSGTTPLKRFYPDASGESDIFTNDYHAFSVLFYTIPLIPLAYANRANPSVLARLVQTITFIILTMSGLIIGMKDKLAANEFSFAIYLNIALITLANLAIKNVTPSNPNLSPFSPAKKATLFTVVLNFFYFFLMNLGRRNKFNDYEVVTSGTSGFAWISADLLFTALVGVFAVRYGNNSDNVNFAKATVLVMILAELYNRFWAYEGIGSITESCVVHVVSALLQIIAIRLTKSDVDSSVEGWMRKHATAETTTNNNNNNDFKMHPVIPIAMFIVFQAFWTYQYLNGGKALFDFDLTAAEIYQNRLQGLSITWYLIPLIGIAFNAHVRSDISRLSSLNITIQLLTFPIVGIILTLGKSTNSGKIRDDLFNFGLVYNVVVFLFARLGIRNAPFNKRAFATPSFSVSELAFLVIIVLNVYFYLSAVFNDGSRNSGYESAGYESDRTGAPKWLALNILSITIVFGGVLTYGESYEALFLTKVFTFVIFISEVFNHTFGRSFMPREAKNELVKVHMLMFVFLVMANRDLTTKLKFKGD